jgi:glutamate carboxypeptidase
MPDPLSPKALLQQLRPRAHQMLGALQVLVETESSSLEKGRCDRCAQYLADLWRTRNTQVEMLAQKHRGDHLRITWWPWPSRPCGQLLVLGHYDTVYASGTLARMPFRVEGGKAFGPGAFDMKAGIVQALFALETLQQVPAPLKKRVVFLWTSDEEIGSESSQSLIESEAGRSDAVFVLEPSFGPKGLLKTARKGVGEAELLVHGRASHAGLAPQEGVNAIHELALQLAKIQKWNDPRRGITVNANLIEGGTRTNVVAERARTVLDLRALHAPDIKLLEKRLKSLRPVLRGAKLEVHGGFNRQPLERKVSSALFSRAKSLAAQMGLTLGECTAGGGSDGNLTAALGVPTLDGLGAVGDGAHSAHEHVIVSAMPERSALLAALFMNS